MADLKSKTDQEIDAWIANYVRLGKTAEPFYRELLEERGRRGTAKHRLDIEKSLVAVMDAAKQQKCITYGSLAAASGVGWSKARRAMDGAGGHLDRLLDICAARGLPLLTALVVNQGGLAKGELGPDALRGFCAGARRLGLSVPDEAAFHREQRDASLAWGRSQL